MIYRYFQCTGRRVTLCRITTAFIRMPNPWLQSCLCFLNRERNERTGGMHTVPRVVSA